MKSRRHQMILSIIADQVVETQDDLVAALCSRGLQVTQATVSRDIKELRLAKVATADGGYRYAVPSVSAEAASEVLQRAQRAFDEYVISVECTHNLVLVKTLPGTAPAIAASIDALGLSDIMGTIAGDDAILVVTKDAELTPPSGPTAVVYRRLSQLAKGGR